MDVLEFDGSGANVTLLAETASYREWRVANVPADSFHFLGLRGKTVSKYFDDIEVDLQVWQTGTVFLFDGVGAVMDYTVAKLNVTTAELDPAVMSESLEQDPGEILYRIAVPGGEVSTNVPYKIEQVLPEDLKDHGYKLRAMVVDAANAKVELFGDDLVAFTDAQYLLDDLPVDVRVIWKARSTAELDSGVKVHLIDVQDQSEVGGGSARDRVMHTSVDLEFALADGPFSGASTDFQFTFSVASPATLMVDCRLDPFPKGSRIMDDLATRPHYFTMQSSVGGSSLRWDPDNIATASVAFGWLSATAIFTGLPLQNADFGQKEISVSFYDPNYATNNGEQWVWRSFWVFYPATGSVSGIPNWYRFWSQTSAGNPSCTYANIPGSNTQFLGGVWVPQIGNDGFVPAASPPPLIWNGALGIDRFAHLCRHEAQHGVDMSVWWPGGYNAALDAGDGDLFPDIVEPIWGWPFLVYNPTLMATYPDTFNYAQYGGTWRDVEHWCLSVQASWTNHQADSVDWCDPGMQHGTQGDSSD